jgi:hypothetical protein
MAEARGFRRDDLMSEVTLDRAALAKSWENRSKGDPGVTWVAFFNGRRPWVFDALIHWFQESLRSRLFRWLERDWVRLAPIGQIHATLIGLEASRDRGKFINRNLKEVRNGAEIPAMDLEGFTRYLQRVPFPIPLRFGGFAPDTVNPYDPRSPYERSFAIRSDGLIVAVGWPVQKDLIQPALFNLRKGAESFQIVHKYHARETDCDNDAFLVLGAVTPMPWVGEGKPRDGFEGFVAALTEVQETIRESLRTAALELALNQEHCCIVRYHSANLAGVPSRDILPLGAVTAESLRGLY